MEDKQCRWEHFNTTKLALIDFSHSTSVAKIDSLGTTAVSEYYFEKKRNRERKSMNKPKEMTENCDQKQSIKLL